MKNGRFGLTLIGALILVALLLALVGPKLVQKAPPSRSVAADTSRTAGVTAKGVVESADDVELTSQIKGSIARVLVEEGATVSRGQLLLEFQVDKIEAQRQQALSALTAAQSRYDQARNGYRGEDVKIADSATDRARAVYDQARDDYERQRRLLTQGATTQVEMNRASERLRVAEGDLFGAAANLSKYRTGTRHEEREQAHADVERARADLRYVESILKDYRVHAPIAGVIAERHKDRGEGVDIGMPLFRLINPASLRIRAELEETDLGRVKEGQPVEVTADAYRDRAYRGRVSKIFPVVRKKSQKSFDPMASFDINTQKVHITLDNYSGLRSGVTVNVRFQ